MNSRQIAALCEGKRVLDIGCGRNKFPGSTGIDHAGASDADLFHDLNHFPYPVADDAFEVVLMRNVIEHIQNIVGLMEEVHRVGSPGARVVITTPHFSSLYSYQDPTHVRHLAYDSLDYFTENTRHTNFYSLERFRMVDRSLDFGRSFPFSHIARLLFALSEHKYEKHFAFIFPCNSIAFQLEVIK
jgi:SAM-dependent methyltransferase